MSPLIATFAFILLGFFLFTSFKRRAGYTTLTKVNRKLPPGPTPLPIIGSLHLLRHLAHRVLHTLAKTHGPIMSMRLGSVQTVVVSSARVAEAFLKNNDLVFASRPKTHAYEYIAYGSKGIVFTEYGPYWRNARKLCTMQLLSGSKTESFEYVRREEMLSVVRSFKKETGKVVNLSKKVQGMVENITYRIVLGCVNKVDDFDLKGLISQMFRLGGLFNIADFMPYLEPLDLQGLKRGMKKLSKKIDKLLEKIIDEHEEMAASRDKDEQHPKDFVDILLSQMNQPITTPFDDDHDHHQPHILSRLHIKAIIMDMLLASLDTSSTAVEWAMSELLRHPTAMKRLQQEIRGVIGLDRTVEEKDLPKFPYLDMVLKESLRLHPVGPFLFRQESPVIDEHVKGEITINGYYIPKNSWIMFNQWAIGRDPEAWSENAEEFIPERFEVDSGLDYRGNDNRFMPFGSGRRGCPGIHLGTMTIRLVVAQLVHCFDWELPHGMSPNDLDMNEEPESLTMPRAKDLLVLPTYRLNLLII